MDASVSNVSMGIVKDVLLVALTLVSWVLSIVRNRDRADFRLQALEKTLESNERILETVRAQLAELAVSIAWLKGQAAADALEHTDHHGGRP